MVNLALEREPTFNAATLGSLFKNGVFTMYTLEDMIRPPFVKVDHETCIWPGRFEVTVNWSNHFQRQLFLLLNVPYFTGVRMHWGNKPKDTDGCILVGDVKHKDEILSSKLAFERLWNDLCYQDDASKHTDAQRAAIAGPNWKQVDKLWLMKEPTFITITNPPDEVVPDLTGDISI